MSESRDTNFLIEGIKKRIWGIQCVLNTIIEAIIEALIKDGKVNLRYLGTFYVKKYKATGYPDYLRIMYRPSQLIKDRINEKGEEYTAYDRLCDKILSQ